MIYTSGVVTDLTREETLEELQDNKLSIVCSKLHLGPEDRLLDIGCGWGTLTAYAAKNFGCDATGVTLAKNQTQFGNDRIKANGISPDKARILCSDYRDIAVAPGYFTKIISLEMAEVSLNSLYVPIHSIDIYSSTSVSVVMVPSSVKSTTSSMTMASSSSKLPVSVPLGNMRTLSGVSS